MKAPSMAASTHFSLLLCQASRVIRCACKSLRAGHLCIVHQAETAPYCSMKNRNRSSFTEALTLSHRVGHIVVRSTVALLCLLALGTSLALWRDRIQPVVAAMPARDDKTLSGIKANIVTLPYHTRPTGYPNLTLT